MPNYTATSGEKSCIIYITIIKDFGIPGVEYPWTDAHLEAAAKAFYSMLGETLTFVRLSNQELNFDFGTGPLDFDLGNGPLGMRVGAVNMQGLSATTIALCLAAMFSAE